MRAMLGLDLRILLIATILLGGRGFSSQVDVWT